MFKHLIVGVVAVVATVSMAFAQGGRGAPTLKPGDAAPTLKDAVWLKGAPATEWKKGTVYVLDFWATWCGPCVASIPHINDLQKEYKDKNVQVIGVAIWPRAGMKPTKAYVESRGDEMNYTIAEDVDGKIAAAFMETTNSNGIPTAMVIDGEGRLAWIGHPMAGMDSVIERVVSGSFDVKEEAERARKMEEMRARSSAIVKQFQEAQASADWDSLIDAADKLLELDPERFGQAALAKYYVTLVEKRDPETAAKYGRSLVSGIFAEQSLPLNAFAWMIVDDTSISDQQRDLELALLAANRANELTEGKDPSVIDTLARVHFERGDTQKAVETQTLAITLVTDPEQKKSYEETLVKYQAGPAPKE